MSAYLTTRVYYSKTADNKFLEPSYVESLRRDLDPQMAIRMLEGKWVAIGKGGIYHQYSVERNFRKGVYEVNPNHPIRIHWDFNIGDGKPMSTCASQFIDGVWHFFDESVIETARTQDILEDWEAKGIFERQNKFIIHGDCNGGNKDTRSPKSDYQIIREFLQRYTRSDGSRLEFEQQVAASNPPLRRRHNVVNAYLQNDLKEVRLFVYEKCPKLDQGFRLTKLKKGSDYIEDDSKDYQHVTTAAGYGIMYMFNEINAGKSNYRR